MTMFSGALNEGSTPLVSIVVPIYSVEQYLGECLRSIASQTYKNLEIILVDDGSTDSSSTTCRKAATGDAQFRYFYKDNGGLSAARNWATYRRIENLDVVHSAYCLMFQLANAVRKRMR